ncbi:porin [Chitinimonas sp. BJYL2]|uniref:porin n=1 Tax=Chitinimonas sp. BJYL2 TaxID=2976696 RepID=UPI0022B4A566|nr:porin [Chitinimonas sp. BJYL2]
MNKKLIALAVSAAALAPAVYAENEVILYGQLNVAVQAGKINVANGAAQSDQLGVQNMASRIGVKGQEDLGGGMSAFFLVETDVAPDNSANSGSFASREGWVGLKGDFGTVSLGRGKSLYTKTTEELDIWYLDQSLGLTANSSGDHVYRVSNAIRYTYEAGPLTFGIENGFGENKASGKKANNDLGANVKFAAEDFSVFGSLHTVKADGVPTEKHLVVGGSFALGDVTLGAAVQRRDTGSVKFTDPLVSIGYAVGDLSLNAGVISWDKDMGDAKAQVNLAGYYSLSKRTVAMVEYTNNYAGVKKNNVLSVGVSHSF